MYIDYSDMCCSKNIDQIPKLLIATVYPIVVSQFAMIYIFQYAHEVQSCSTSQILSDLSLANYRQRSSSLSITTE